MKGFHIFLALCLLASDYVSVESRGTYFVEDVEGDVEQAGFGEVTAEEVSVEQEKWERSRVPIGGEQESPEHVTGDQEPSEEITYDQSGTVCLQEHNHYRRQAGKTDLAGDINLVAAARSHNDAMVNNNCFEHRCPWERQLSARVSRAGYHWGSVSENIASGQPDCDIVTNSWINSARERENMLGNFEHVGCVFENCTGCKYNIYWTCVFGNPA